ncbi:hypothetical protein DL93DRAFT_493955 [Clavulina sp. PMI_390]|nr:hypothetical protein DL93DRAFT_493955 [Clavulina sp. PMI_390]
MSLPEPVYQFVNLQPPTESKMLVPYTRREIGHADGAANWLGETVATIVSSRDASWDATRYHQAILNFGDSDAAGTWCHHIPYARIMHTLINEMEGRTRQQILDGFRGVGPNFNGGILGALGLPNNTPGFGAGAPALPTDNRVAFDTFVTWACEAICDWPNNQWRGTGLGDNGGRNIDYPVAGSTHHAALVARFTATRAALQAAIPTLSLAHTVNLG